MLRREEDANYIILVYASDIALTLAAFFAAYQARLTLPYGVRPLTPEEIDMPVGLYLLIIVIWTGTFWGLKVYDSHTILNFSSELRKLIPTIGLAAFVFAGVLYLSYRNTPRLMFIYFVLLDTLFLVGYRGVIQIILHWRGARLVRPMRVIVVGTGEIAQIVANRIQEQSASGLTITGFITEQSDVGDAQLLLGLPILGSISDTLNIIDEQTADYVVFALPIREHQSLREITLLLYERPVRIFVVPDVLDLAFFRVSVQEWNGIPILGLKEPVIKGVLRVVKRSFDLLVAAALTITLWPVMLIAAIAIKLDSPGEIILRQTRVGENGKLFTLYKFRSMIQNADKLQAGISIKTSDGHLLHKHQNDPRVTRVGRILRRTSIDELPQLFNVLKGDMSMVGPRPELPYIVEQYEPWQHKRFAVPPGITGWWQISGRSDNPMHLHTEDDLYYITHYSPWLDIQILIKTIWVVLKGEGAY